MQSKKKHAESLHLFTIGSMYTYIDFYGKNIIKTDCASTKARSFFLINFKDTFPTWILYFFLKKLIFTILSPLSFPSLLIGITMQ